MSASQIRILIADDHPIVRDGLTAVLSTQVDFAVIGEVANGLEVLEKVVADKPDVILLDLDMPEMNGVETIQALSSAESDCRIIVFTAYDTDDQIVSALRAGAQGYLLKGAPRDELFNAIRIVAAGGSLLQPVVASRLMQHMATPEPEVLTARETEVLQQLARGLQNKEIARELHITERTVKFHVSSLLAKLNAGNRTEAVTIALKRGLV